jgi:indole-3-glycerol phosphate synthase
MNSPWRHSEARLPSVGALIERTRYRSSDRVGPVHFPAMGFLSELIERIREDHKRKPPDESRLLARAMATPPPRDFAAGLAEADPPAMIAEIKRASPSAGGIADVDPSATAVALEEAGAAALSVLTESRYFDGSLSDLRAARVHTRIPILRKDFLVHPAQVMESRATGADAVLLITACLSSSELEAMVATARDLGLAALVEAHSDEDLDRALASGARIIGVNARDLETLDVDEQRALDLARRVPPDRFLVFESGISTRTQVERAVDAGARAILVGEALMRAKNPGAKLRALRGVLAAAVASEDDAT